MAEAYRYRVTLPLEVITTDLRREPRQNTNVLYMLASDLTTISGGMCRDVKVIYEGGLLSIG